MIVSLLGQHRAKYVARKPVVERPREMKVVGD